MPDRTTRRRLFVPMAISALGLGLVGSLWWVLASERDCGEEAFDITGRASDPAVRECLWESYRAVDRARSRHVRPTIEGDPITWTVHVRGLDQVELVIDSREDRFSRRDIRTIHCTGMARDRETESVGGIRLTLVGCQGGNVWQIP
jgi:hypothetical protein